MQRNPFEKIMPPVVALAVLTLRGAIRSRLVITMLVLLLLTIIGLPLTLKGDGTVQGYAHIILHYTLSLTGIILSIVTVWVGCSTVSMEIQDRSLHLVVTKPVHRFSLWLGKWLGILGLNASFLAFSGIVIYGLFIWTLRPALHNDTERRILQEEVMIARERFIPDFSHIEEQARTSALQQMRENPDTEHQDAEALYQTLYPALMRNAHTVPAPGKAHMALSLDQTPLRKTSSIASFHLFLFAARPRTSYRSMEHRHGRSRRAVSYRYDQHSASPLFAHHPLFNRFHQRHPSD